MKLHHAKQTMRSSMLRRAVGGGGGVLITLRRAMNFWRLLEVIMNESLAYGKRYDTCIRDCASRVFREAPL